MSTLRERLLAKSCPEELIAVEGEQILIRGLSAKRRNELYAAMPKKEEGERMTAEEITHLEAEVVIHCAFDPVTKQPLFDKADRDALGAMPGSVLSAMSGPAFRLSGMNPQSREAAKNA